MSLLFTPLPGQVVLDIGANDGAYAEGYAKAVGETGVVWAVEPHPDALAKARERLAPYRHVTVQPFAVTSTFGSGAILYPDSDLRRSSLWAPNRLQQDAVPIEVRTTTVDVLVKWMPRYPDWIKVDAQGAEGEILKGAQQTLDDKRATWVVEVWALGLANAGSSVEAVLEQFKSRGYTPSCDGTVRAWDWLQAACAKKQGHGAADVVFRP